MTTACEFLIRSDINFYGILVEGLENSYTQGGGGYPKTLSDAYKLLVNWKKDPRNYLNIFREAETNGKVAFFNIGDESSAGGLSLTKTCIKFNIMCFRCNNKGQYSNEFTN